MSPADPARRKQALRTRFRNSRRALKGQARTLLDQRIRQHLADRVEHQSPEWVGAYLSFDGEPDIEPALMALRERGFRIALPVLSSSDFKTMTLHAWTQDTPLVDNRFGIPEPVSGERIALQHIDLLLLPLVAYDRDGTRLGVGGGFYDRLLATGSPGCRPHLTGVAYSLQQAPALPREDWDVPLHAVINENGWFSFPL
jgi:5-formyltetrahydrofolate cyclo-ligase